MLITLVLHAISLEHDRTRRNYKSSEFDSEIKFVVRCMGLRQEFPYRLRSEFLCFRSERYFRPEARRDFIFHFSPRSSNENINRWKQFS